MTIEANGPAEEVTAWLARLQSSDDVAPSKASVWTPELASRLLRRISTRAREALEIMVAGAPIVSFEDIQEKMGLSGVRIGGVLASFGFAENAGFPRPYRVDKDQRVYVIDPQAAEAIREALEAESD